MLAIQKLWNGTNWTEVNDLNTARATMASIGDSSTSALYAGGYTPPGYVANVEEWNGVSWAEVADLGTARSNHGAAGTNTAGLVFSGEFPPGLTTSTEEWSSSSNVVKTLTD